MLRGESMITFMKYNENYFDICNASNYKTVIYGAGIYGKKALAYLYNNVSCVCDKQAENIKEINGVKVITPKQLEALKTKFVILICVKSEKIRAAIKEELSELSIDALAFDLFDNAAFDLYREKTLSANLNEKRRLHRIRIICEDSGWIFEKFAIKMKTELCRQGYDCTIADTVDPTSEINHHFFYGSCEPILPLNETFMITHIDSINKVELLKHQLKTALMGICMSRETLEKLTAYGIPREKLCYINPAQDGVIKPKKYVLGITHRTYKDHRKKVNVLIDLCKELDPAYFSFKIMGSGWDDIVDSIINMGFQIEYYREFDYEEYTKLIPSLDYYLFFGFDEGSMGFLDALHAGVETIVTPQGFHLDIKDGITYPCRTMNDFKETLLKLQEKRKKIVASVDTLTWENFVNKHLEVWNYLLGNEEDIYKNQHFYEDGIFSVLRINA